MLSKGFVIGNRLLACVPDETLTRLMPDLETVPIRVGDILHQVGRSVEHVYLPYSGMGSIVVLSSNGMSVETATIGNEGVLGVSPLLGDPLATEQTMVQMSGEAARLRLQALRTAFERDEFLHHLLLRYAQLLMGQIAQGSACSRVHTIEARCARWLLSTHDRVEGDEFPLTQRFLAMMLGVRRSGVSGAQHKLQQDGLIRYARGTITILDRRGLESAACECYDVIHTRLERFYAQYQERPAGVVAGGPHGPPQQAC